MARIGNLGAKVGEFLPLLFKYTSKVQSKVRSTKQHVCKNSPFPTSPLIRFYLSMEQKTFDIQPCKYVEGSENKWQIFLN